MLQILIIQKKTTAIKSHSTYGTINYVVDLIPAMPNTKNIQIQGTMAIKVYYNLSWTL